MSLSFGTKQLLYFKPTTTKKMLIVIYVKHFANRNNLFIENCSFSELFNISNVKCLPSLSKATEDTADYGLNWGSISKYVNKPLLIPFTYQQDTGSLMFGELM